MIFWLYDVISFKLSKACASGRLSGFFVKSAMIIFLINGGVVTGSEAKAGSLS
jgi:hypothetical protein